MFKGILLVGIIFCSLSSKALEGVLGKYISEQEFYQLSNKIMDRTEVRGAVVRLDLRDGVKCIKLKNYIRRFHADVDPIVLDGLCIRTTPNPYKDFVVLQTEETEPLLEYIKTGVSIGVSAYKSQGEGFDPQAPIQSLEENEFLLSPLFATLLTESINHVRARVRDNKGRLASSKILGKAMMIITNPAESLGFVFDQIFQHPVISSAETQIRLKDFRQDHEPSSINRPILRMNVLEFNMILRFK